MMISLFEKTLENFEREKMFPKCEILFLDCLVSDPGEREG